MKWEDAKEWLYRCTRCGTCKYILGSYLPSCPSGETFKFESYFASGKILIGRAILEGKISFLDARKELYACTGCGSCMEQCSAPISRNLVDIFEALRAEAVASAGLMENHLSLVNSIKSYDNPWMQPRWMKERWMEGEIKEGKDVLYLVGCTGAIFPSIPRSTYRLLSLAGISPLVLGKEERCCGSILKRIGETQLWEKYAKENIKMLNSLRISTLVTSCAGCYRTIRKEYEEIGELDFDVLHSSQLINEFVRDGMLEFSALRKNVTYHDPCHLGRHSGVYDEPREILRSIPGLSLVEMERTKRNSFCCGAGGGVFSGFPQIAKGTALSRVKEAIGAGAEILLSACPFCYQNLRDAAKGEIEVMDLCELLWNQSRSK